MPVATRSRVTAACGGGEGALAWGSASAAPAPRDGVASHHHGLKEKMRALTLLYDQHKQQIAASQAGGAAARPLRRSIRSLSAAEVVNDENAKNAEEEEQGGGVAVRHRDAFALVPEAAVLREKVAVAPPQPRAPSKDSHIFVFARPAEPQEKENVVGHAGNAMSSLVKKVVPMLRAPATAVKEAFAGR